MAKDHTRGAKIQRRIATGAVRPVTDSADIVVIGSTPLAGMLAGLLRERHQRSVALMVDPEAGYRLPRGIDLSMGPMTRPESFEMVLSGRDETLRLMSRFAERADLTSVDPVFVARSAQARIALAHVHHMAAGYGLVAERHAYGRGGETLIVHDATLIRRDRFVPHLEAWLTRIGVDVVPGLPNAVRATGPGSFEVTAAGSTLGCGLAVLADADAIQAAGVDDLPGLARRGIGIVLGQAGRGGAAGVKIDLDTGALVSADSAGAALGFGYGDETDGRGAIADLMELSAPLPLSARRWVDTLVSEDGAAVIGRLHEGLPFVIAGLGVSGFCLAPALARRIAGAASQAEDDWFAARAPGADRRHLADIGMHE